MDRRSRRIKRAGPETAAIAGAKPSFRRLFLSLLKRHFSPSLHKHRMPGYNKMYVRTARGF
jgi:hypothetical protein